MSLLLDAISSDSYLTDFDVALQLFAEETGSLAARQADHTLAQRLRNAELHRISWSPSTVGQDAATGTSLKLKTLPGEARSYTGPTMIVKLVHNMSRRKSADALPISSTKRSLLHRHSSPKSAECVVCQTAIQEQPIRVPCGHHYDLSCLLGLVQVSTRDETLFPPRCCRQTIPTTCFTPHMDSALAALFAQKTVEYNTPKRVYCANPVCSHFLGPRSKTMVPKMYTCPASGCPTRTCGRCRSEVKAHILHNCRQDPDSQQVLTLGQRAGWIQCPGCDQMIELQSGCYHVTCRCKSQFCYRCRAPWKTCACPRWDENLLIEHENPPRVSLHPPPFLHRQVLWPTRIAQETRAMTELERRPTDYWDNGSDISASQARDRVSAPAELESFARVRDDLFIRGFDAQQRRKRLRAVRQEPHHDSESSISDEDDHPLDTVDAQIERLLHDVERFPCRHDWGLQVSRGVCESCYQTSAVLSPCLRCTSRVCATCRLDRL